LGPLRTFDEAGGCSVSGSTGSCSSFTATDPTGLVTTQSVLIFRLPTLVFTGAVNVFDPGGTTISDRLQWVCSSGPGNCGTLENGTIEASNEMIFYSFDSNGLAADVGSVANIPSTGAFFTTEAANGTFQWVVPPPGIDIYNGSSTVPLPAALPLFATGLGALGLLGWRRKRKAGRLNNQIT
jgi:hypothetical protein